MKTINVQKTCPVCGKTFSYSKWYENMRPVSGRPPKYCSKECKRKRNSLKVLEKYRGENNFVSTKEIEILYDMRKRPCIRCGFSDVVVLHDIIPVKEGGNKSNPSNRIPLCPNCHATLHKSIWKIWEIEDILEKDVRYTEQYWLVQVLKSENHQYCYGSPQRFLDPP